MAAKFTLREIEGERNREIKRQIESEKETRERQTDINRENHNKTTKREREREQDPPKQKLEPTAYRYNSTTAVTAYCTAANQHGCR